MLKPQLVLLVLAVVLGGCSTEPPEPIRDWSSAMTQERPMEVQHVSEGPKIAPVRDIEQAIPPVRTNANPLTGWVSLPRWVQENKIGTLTQLSAAPTRSFSLLTSNGVFIFNINSLAAKWQGTEFRLGFEPQMINDQPYLHVLDLKKNVEPLLTKLPTITRTNRVIVIDPGHGGMNAGTRSVFDNANEKEFALDVARKLEPLLATNGWQVFLTRSEDIEVPLPERVGFAEAHKADLFVSLHFNSAAPNHEQTGLETFCLTPSGMKSTLTREYEDNPALIFANNSFDTENFRYAMLLHRTLLKDCGFVDRGIRRARFLGVLRGQNRPAVLIEAGYLSNPHDAKQIADATFREKLAEAIASALNVPIETSVPEATTLPTAQTNNPALP